VPAWSQRPRSAGPAVSRLEKCQPNGAGQLESWVTETLIQLGQSRRPSQDAENSAQSGEDASPTGGGCWPSRGSADRGPPEAQQTAGANEAGSRHRTGEPAQPGPKTDRAGRERPRLAQKQLCWPGEAGLNASRPTGASSGQGNTYVGQGYGYAGRGSYMPAQGMLKSTSDILMSAETWICRPGHKYAGPRKSSAGPEMPM
jgi:hypothetical protein